jgi:hypothetical protein
MKRLLFLLLLVPGLLEAQTVTITGDGAATTVELTGPTGPAGSIGPTGPQGPAGPAGGTYAQVLFSALGTPVDGTSYYCTDCLETDPCAGSGTGAFAFRVGSVWSCAKGGTGNMADPGADGFMARTAVDTSVARTLTSPLGTLAIGNATGVAGNPTLDVDTSIMGQFATGAGSFGGTCTPGDWYYETDTFFATFCPVTDTGYTVVSLPHASGVPTDDNVLVGSGTAWAKKALPDCDDSAGNHLNYDTATNAWSCGTSTSGTSGYQAATFTIYDEMMGGMATTGLIGETGAQFAAVATGTIAKYNVPPFFYRLNSHVSNDNSGIDLYLGAGGVADVAFAATDWDFTTRIILGSNATAITNTAIWVGISRSTPSGANNGFIGIRRDTDLGDGAFVLLSCNAAGAAGCQAAGDDTNQRVVASTITPSAGSAYTFKIRHRLSGVGAIETYYISVNGEAEKTFCGAGCDETFFSLSTNVYSVIVTHITRTTTGVMSSDIDYHIWTSSGLTR